MKKIIIDEDKCVGCGLCIPQCRQGAIKIIDGKAKVFTELCDGAGACIGRCPQGAISFEEKAHEKKQACGCPSAHVMKLQKSHHEAQPHVGISELTSWPVQLRLVPPQAPFLDNADILIAADCVPCAYPGFHSDLLKGKVLLVGCPKFDDLDLYQEKIISILKANRIKSITYAHMEVPCCLGLKPVIEESIRNSGKNVAFQDVVITIEGKKR